MTFGEHLDELRRRIIRALVGLGAASLLCGYFSTSLLEALVRPFEQASLMAADQVEASYKPGPPGSPPPPPMPPNVRTQIERLRAPRLIAGGPLVGYVTTIIVCILAGTVVASPWIIYQIWAFVGVGLYPHEKRYVHLFGPISFVLFIGGAALFYLLLLPVGLQALMTPTMGVAAIEATFTLEQYSKFVAWMTLVFGLAFQMPIVVLFLARTRIIPLRTLARQQKIVILAVLIIAAVLTPTVDPLSMFMMAIPLMALYELGLLFAWLAERKDRRRAAPRKFDEP